MKQLFSSNDKELRPNMMWQIGLDLQNLRFRFLPIPTDINVVRIKLLSLKDIGRFGLSPEDDDEPDDSESFLCASCGLWLNGFCCRHPLIFVKEMTPKERPYLHHATFPDFFYLQESTIPKAGQGVFTQIVLPIGVAFGPYSGFVSSSRKAETSGYSWQIHQADGSDCWVDAKNPFYSNWMRYVNCARFEQEQNLVALLYNQNIYYYTYKPVAVNEELLVWYGREYGDFLRIKNALRESGPLAPSKEESEESSLKFIEELEVESVIESLNPAIKKAESQTEVIEPV